VNTRKSHEIWIEQCDAAQAIRLRYGLKAAFDYVVAEKLLNFAEAAGHYPQFAQELPRFVSRVRKSSPQVKFSRTLLGSSGTRGTPAPTLKAIC